MIQFPLCAYFKFYDWDKGEIIKIKIYGVTKVTENLTSIIFYLNNGKIEILDKDNNLIEQKMYKNDCYVEFNREQILNTVRLYLRSDLA